MRKLLRAVLPACGLLGLLGAASGCSGGRSDEEKVLDSIVTSTDRIFGEIEADGSTWLVTADEGAEVKGTLENGIGGTVAVVGWRSSDEHETDRGFHISFTEKLFLSYANWQEEDMLLSGTLTLTRHSHDFGPPEGAVEDASRMTSYRGALTTSGPVSGGFDVDVHAQASGAVLWTCGVINDREMGHGACF